MCVYRVYSVRKIWLDSQTNKIGKCDADKVLRNKIYESTNPNPEVIKLGAAGSNWGFWHFYNNTFPASLFSLWDFQYHIDWTEVEIVWRINCFYQSRYPTKVLTKHNFAKYIKGIFFEINFRKPKWLLCRIYHPPFQNDQ